MSKRVVIFGSSGNSGRQVVRFFINLGWEVVGVSRSEMGPVQDGYSHVTGDIRDPLLYRRIEGFFDLAVNFAGIQPSILGYSESENYSKALSDYLEINVVGTSNVLRFVAETGIPTYIFATSHRDIENHWSSSKMLSNNLPISVNTSGDHALYAVSKVSGMLLGDCVGTHFGFRVFNLRLPMMFLVPKTPFYFHEGHRRVMPYLAIIRDALEGRPLQVWGDKDMRRDYVHVDNLCNLLYLCFKSKLDRGTFAVGTGEGVSTEKFIKAIRDEFSPEPEDTRIAYLPNKRTYKATVYDVSEQKTLLGYQPILLPEMLSLIHRELIDTSSLKKWGWA
jgi:UDP-glucose 4-epimerase